MKLFPECSLNNPPNLNKGQGGALCTAHFDDGNVTVVACDVQKVDQDEVWGVLHHQRHSSGEMSSGPPLRLLAGPVLWRCLARWRALGQGRRSGEQALAQVPLLVPLHGPQLGFNGMDLAVHVDNCLLLLLNDTKT